MNTKAFLENDKFIYLDLNSVYVVKWELWAHKSLEELPLTKEFIDKLPNNSKSMYFQLNNIVKCFDIDIHKFQTFKLVNATSTNIRFPVDTKLSWFYSQSLSLFPKNTKINITLVEFAKYLNLTAQNDWSNCNDNNIEFLYSLTATNRINSIQCKIELQDPEFTSLIKLISDSKDLYYLEYFNLSLERLFAVLKAVSNSKSIWEVKLEVIKNEFNPTQEQVLQILDIFNANFQRRIEIIINKFESETKKETPHLSNLTPFSQWDFITQDYPFKRPSNIWF